MGSAAVKIIIEKGKHQECINDDSFSFSQDEVKNLFDDFFSTKRPMFSMSQKLWNPPTDVYETNDSVIVKMEIAGVRKEDLDITVEENLLKIRGNRKMNTQITDANYHVMEIHYGNFERVFRLPRNLDSLKIDANYKDGFLTVNIPKSKNYPQEIKVRIED